MSSIITLPPYLSDESYRNVVDFKAKTLAALNATEIVEKAMSFAVNAHREANHFYDGFRYEVHLELVFAVGCKYVHLVLNDVQAEFLGEPTLPLYGIKPEEGVKYALAGLWTHDLIDDARITYNQITKKLNPQIAEFTFALSNNKGRTPEERENEAYYHLIRNTPYAVFGKLSDRIANARYGLDQGGKGKQFLRYKQNYNKFKDALWNPVYKPMFDELEEIFS
jgi:(p)ppGpp synthase/HD superfamily hydrolase